MALVGNLRLWTVQELVSSVLLCNHKSIQGETVRKVCENFQYLDMGIFVHILSGSVKLETKVTDIPAEEQVIWDTLAYAWNKFCDLKQEHPQEQEEFMRGIYMCQYALGMRLNRKNYPDVFYKMP